MKLAREWPSILRPWSILAFSGCMVAHPLAAAERTPVVVNQAADAIVNYLVQKPEKGGHPLGKGATREMALAGLRREVDQYEGTGVTHIFWNVNYQRAAYRSDVWPSYWDVSDPEKETTEWPRSYYELHKLGIDDVFAILIPRCRERGLSPWVSLRMNDHHYTGNPTRVSPLLFDHPELRTRGGKGLFNYARPEVREHYLKLVTEVLQRYDVDGLELDWIRTPSNFDAADRERGREIITGFVRDVRQQTMSAARRLGHPVRLAVRVPATPAFALGKGFDAVAWARAGWVDVIIPSDWWSGCADTPVEEWRAQMGPDARHCQILPFTAPTYACTAKGLMMSHNLAATRGFVASMLDRGADGIYFFNTFQPVTSNVRLRTPSGRSEIDCVVGDLFRAASRGSDAIRHARVHALTIHDCVPDKTDVPPSLPIRISAGTPGRLRLHSGPQPVSGSCTLRVGLDGSEDLSRARLAVRLNATPCRAMDDLPVPAGPVPSPEQPRLNVCEVAPRLLQFDVPLPAVMRGYNTVELAVEQGGPQTVIWLEMFMNPVSDK